MLIVMNDKLAAIGKFEIRLLKFEEYSKNVFDNVKRLEHEVTTLKLPLMGLTRKMGLTLNSDVSDLS